MFYRKHRKISKWFKKHSVFARWSGMGIFLVGMVLVIMGILSYQTPTKQNLYLELPSGEENVIVTVDGDPAVAGQVPEGAEQVAGSGNKIIIPRMEVDAQIFEGGIEKLSQGVWLLPYTSTPDQGGNTVISSHRWKFKPPDPRTFYNIDKMQGGDSIKIIWKGKKYYYTVREVKIITADQTEILYPTKDSILTIFSCTPLYKTTHRLVVIADLVKAE